MLAVRIIPCLDVDAGRVVKGVNFVNIKDAGDPVEVARLYDEQQADEIIFLDITASYQKREILIDIVRKTAEVVFIPLTVGGGIKELIDIERLLRVGADRVAINTAAVIKPEFIQDAARRFGSQCIVVAIDAKICDDNRWKVYIHGGRTLTGIDAIEWAKKVAQLGAGEILLTSMDRDGTENGYDLPLIKAITSAVHIPVIASGGAGNLHHFYELLTKTKAQSALAASLFHYQKCSIKEVKNYLKERGIIVRL